MKKIITLLFVCLMVSTLLFANGTKEAVAPTGSTVNKTGLPIVNEKETFKIAVFQTSPLKEAALRECVIAAENATNIHIEWVEIPQSAWKEKINIMFSTGNLPDAIIGDVSVNKNYEQLVAISDFTTEYAPNFMNLLAKRPDYKAALTAPDGKMHAFPTGEEAPHNMIDSTTWINSAWLTKLGLKMPTTTAEFKTVLQAFKNQDPNGNGLKDEVPFVFKGVWGWANAMENMFGSFGVVESGAHVFVDGNKVVFSAQEQAYYDALKYFNELYNDGLISPECFTMSSEQYKSFAAGKDTVGTFIAWRPNSGSPISATIQNGTSKLEDYSMLPILEGPKGDKIVFLNNTTRDGGFAITTTCKNPTALVRWYDYINTNYEIALPWARGPKGVWWDLIEKDGKKVPLQLIPTEDDFKALGYSSLVEFRNGESFAGQAPILTTLEYFDELQFLPNAPADLRLNWIIENKKFGVNGLPSGVSSVESSERRAILLVDIDNYLEKFVADSIMNGIDDAKWAKHLNSLKALKVPEYLNLCQEYLEANK